MTNKRYGNAVLNMAFWVLVVGIEIGVAIDHFFLK